MGNKRGEFRGNRTTFEKWVLGLQKEVPTDLRGLSRGVNIFGTVEVLRSP